MKQSKFGFTLLEMLVVIGIISIIVSMGFVAYSTVQKKARDTKRKGDMDAVQKVLEQCYSINNYTYPTINGNGTTSIDTNCTALGGPSIAITDPTTKTFTVTNSPAYTVSLTLEDSSIFTISNQQ